MLPLQVMAVCLAGYLVHWFERGQRLRFKQQVPPAVAAMQPHLYDLPTGLRVAQVRVSCSAAIPHSQNQLVRCSRLASAGCASAHVCAVPQAYELSQCELASTHRLSHNQQAGVPSHLSLC